MLILIMAFIEVWLLVSFQPSFLSSWYQLEFMLFLSSTLASLHIPDFEFRCIPCIDKKKILQWTGANCYEHCHNYQNCLVERALVGNPPARTPWLALELPMVLAACVLSKGRISLSRTSYWKVIDLLLVLTDLQILLCTSFFYHWQIFLYLEVLSSARVRVEGYKRTVPIFSGILLIFLLFLNIDFDLRFGPNFRCFRSSSFFIFFKPSRPSYLPIQPHLCSCGALRSIHMTFL